MSDFNSHFEGFRSLQKFGINALTGEACGLNMRTLCDVNEQGKKLLDEFLRMVPIEESWNGNDGAKWSVMLPYDLARPLWIYAMLRFGGAVAVIEGGYRGWECQLIALDNDLYERYMRAVKEDSFEIRKKWQSSDHPGDGFNNTHVMSGRSR